MDNFLLHAISAELESTIVGHRIGKIFQYGATDLLIDFHLRDGRWLAISTDPQRLALYLTGRSPKRQNQFESDPRSDTGFVALLKKYLGGARLLSIEKLGYDRVVFFDFEVEDDSSGAIFRRRLIVSLTGRAANIFLTEEKRVIAALRESEEPISIYVEPSPPAEKLDPFQCSAETLDRLIAADNGDAALATQKRLIGFTATYARELAYRAESSGPFRALEELLTALFEAPPAPAIYSSHSLDQIRSEIGREEYSLTLSIIELLHLAGQRKSSFAGVNEAADAYYTLIDERRRFSALKQKLVSRLSTRIKKQRSLVANLKREREGFSKAGTHRRYGELLLANLHQAAKNDDKFAVTDYYDEAQPIVEIPAANKATAQEAAEHYFKLARKARHGLETIDGRLPGIESELAEMERRLAAVAPVTNLEELNKFAGEERTVEPEKKRAPAGKKRKVEKISGVRRYRSSDGFEILVGRNDRDNDHLTFRIAKSHDLWFHAADYPGSHAVLRNPQRKSVPPRAITEAAQLAAKFSHAKGGAKVAVNYCEKKFVTKMKGFAPGQVRLSSFKTVMVEPGEPGERII